MKNPIDRKEDLPLSPYDLQLLINTRKTLLDKSSNARKDVLKRIYNAAAKMIEAGIAREGGFRLVDSPGGTTWERMTLEEQKNIEEAPTVICPDISSDTLKKITDEPGTVSIQTFPETVKKL